MFFDPLYEFLAGGTPSNPITSTHVYIGACRIARKTCNIPADRSVVDIVLLRYVDFFIRITEERPVEQDQLDTILSFQKFLEQLHADGNGEAYERVVGGADDDDD
ncbi:MAG: hypothetical protein Q7S72_01015 [Candidatus Taylorbacteria bacterium]|nr:hypothetical protein [Candidatus Taylorbacteria bacterium]